MFYHIWPFVTVGIVGCAVASLVSSHQRDLKRLAAYSSVVHINFTLSIMEINSSLSLRTGVGLLNLHGYLSRVFFFLIGEVYHSTGSRMVLNLTGLRRRLSFAGVWGALLFRNRGVPPFVSFLPELFGITSLIGTYIFSSVFLAIYFLGAFYYHIFLFCHSFSGKRRMSIRERGPALSLALLIWGLAYPLLRVLC